VAISGNLYPVSFSWCFWDQRSKQAAANEKQIHQQRLDREAKEMMAVIEELIVAGKKRKLQQ